MNWTKNFPTDTGYYWFCLPGRPAEIIHYNAHIGSIMRIGQTAVDYSVWAGVNDGEFWPAEVIAPAVTISKDTPCFASLQ